MTRTILPHTDASIAYSGTWATNSDASTYTGSYRISTTTGDTITITVPATATGILLKGLAYHNGASTIQVQRKVATTVMETVTWNLNTGTTVTDSRYWWYRALCQPLLYTPGASNTIVITVPSGGKGVAFDGYEWFVSESPTANRMTVWGHSWVYGFSPGAGGDPTSPIAGRLSALLASRLSLTEDNQGVNNEDLCNGITSAVAITDVQTITVDATGGTFTVTPLNPTTGAALTTGTISGVTTTTAATVQTTIRAVGAPYASVTVAGANGGPYAVTMAGITGFVPLMTANSGSLTGGTTHTATIAHTTTGQTANQQYRPQGNAVPGWMLAENYGQAANVGATWSRTPAVFIALHGINDSGLWLTYDLGDTGLSVPAAGVGYSQRRFTQRYKEIFWRVKTLIPTCELWAVTQPPSDVADTAVNRPIFAAINAAIVTAATDPTINAFVADIAGVLGKANGGSVLYCSDDAHPITVGHRIMADAFMDAYRRAHPEKFGQIATPSF